MSTFIGQTEVNGGSGTIHVPVPVGTAIGDLMIAFGIARQTPDSAFYDYSPNVWAGSLSFDLTTDAGDGNGAIAFCVRKINAGETELTLTENGGSVALISVVLQVWRGAAQFFAGAAGEYEVNNGFSVVSPLSGTGPTGDAAPTAIIGGNIAFAATLSIDSVTIDDTDAVSKGYVSYVNNDLISIGVRGFTQGEGGSLYSGPEWGFAPDTLNCVSFLIGFSGAPEGVSEADWTIPALSWTATATVEPFIATGGVVSKRFDAGEGSEWFIVAPVIDSGNELRSKVIGPARVTGKLTNASLMIYTWDVSGEIDLDELEAGTNSATGAISLPDTAHVAQSPLMSVNCPNAVLSTIRVAGDGRGAETRDEVHEALYQQSVQGVRR